MPRRPRLLTHDGRTLSVKDWSRATGIGLTTIRARIDVLDWDVSRALTEPADARKTKPYCVHGHPFDAGNTYFDARGFRHCLACMAARAAARKGTTHV